MGSVVLIGTLDTKGPEYAYLRERIRELGMDTVLIDAGVLGQPGIEPDISRQEVAEAAGTDLSDLVARSDRGAAVSAMARGVAAILQRLVAGGAAGVAGLGGSGGSAVISFAMRQLPIGVPKLLVSTVASSDVRAYVGGSDLTMMHSVVDVAGLNRVSERILNNAAGAIVGMVRAAATAGTVVSERPLIGATMFGVTTPCVTAARARLEELGYEVLVFHAVGTGGQAMEALIRDGSISAVLDVTTTELADELVGGIFSAGPERLSAAADRGVPQVVSLGALDMVNFGPLATVPERFKSRRLHEHNPAITLMRTSAGECAELGRILASRLNRARGPVTVFIPLKGVSQIAVQGQPFRDLEADWALITAIREHLAPTVELRALDTDINDPQFALAMADRLHEHYQRWKAQQSEGTP